MKLDETIKLFEKIAKEYAEKSKATVDVMEMVNLSILDKALNEFIVAETNKQVAEWLRELKAYKKVRRILSQNRIATDIYGDVVLWDDIKRVLEEVNADERI